MLWGAPSTRKHTFGFSRELELAVERRTVCPWTLTLPSAVALGT